MSLTRGFGPLAAKPAPSNYTIDGPPHRILVHDVEKRLRVEVAGEIVADTTRAKMLHESNLLPVYYLPVDDLRSDLLERTDHSTHCRFKGDASYWSVRVGGRVEENLVWTYEEPADEVAVLAGYAAFHLDRVDALYEEDEQVLSHPRDPFHRVDVRRSSRRVRVLAGERVLADTVRPKAVFETGVPVRWYLPADDVDLDALEVSSTTSICPYKGVAAYRSLRDGEADVAWTYPDPLGDGAGLEGHLCFLGESISTEVDSPTPWSSAA